MVNKYAADFLKEFYLFDVSGVQSVITNLQNPDGKQPLRPLLDWTVAKATPAKRSAGDHRPAQNALTMCRQVCGALKEQ